ncbi:hypothetical protein P9112_005667 [Eukaryota sp. TZLM1-RC]
MGEDSGCSIEELCSYLEESLRRSEYLLSSTASCIISAHKTESGNSYETLTKALSTAREYRKNIVSTIRQIAKTIQSLPDDQPSDQHIRSTCSSQNDLDLSVLLKLRSTLVHQIQLSQDSCRSTEEVSQLENDLEKINCELSKRDLSLDSSMENLVDDVVKNDVENFNDSVSLFADCQDSLCENLVVPETPIVRKEKPAESFRSPKMEPSMLSSLLENM